MTTESLIECRRDFEIWAKSESWNLEPHATGVGYKNNGVWAGWNAWRACWELQDARVKGVMV